MKIIFVLVPALGDKFCTSVKGLALINQRNGKLFSQTKVASLLCIVVSPRFLVDRPLDGKVHVVDLQRPDVLGERCTVLVLGVPERLLVVVEPLFKDSCRESRVLLHACVCLHGQLVYDRLGLARSFKGTELFVPTVVACSRFSFILGWTIPKDLAVVLIDNVCDTRHADC